MCLTTGQQAPMLIREEEEEEEASIITVPTSNISNTTRYFSLIDSEKNRYCLIKEELQRKLRVEEKKHRRAILEIKKAFGRQKPTQEEMEAIRQRVRAWSSTSQHAGFIKSNKRTF
jgi:hypothetical protein